MTDADLRHPNAAMGPSRFRPPLPHGIFCFRGDAYQAQERYEEWRKAVTERDIVSAKKGETNNHHTHAHRKRLQRRSLICLVHLGLIGLLPVGEHLWRHCRAPGLPYSDVMTIEAEMDGKSSIIVLATNRICFSNCHVVSVDGAWLIRKPFR